MTAARDGGATERIAWAFYTIAAVGSSLGQIWVGVTTPPWPHQLPWWMRAVLVLPFAVVIDLGGVVTSAFADWRQRLGEAAYGWRILSAASVTVGVAINILGHHDVPYLSVVFGGLGLFAYTVWLLHAAARRRDALRSQGLLGRPTPVYGLRQRKREPEVTRRARTLALTHGYGLHESLEAARAELTGEHHRAALAKHLTALLRARHDDENLANILVAAIPGDQLAAQVANLVDIPGWARIVAVDLQPPATPELPAAQPPAAGPAVVEPAAADSLTASEPEPAAPLPAAEAGGEVNDGWDDEAAAGPPLPAALLREIPSRVEEYARWYQLWQLVRGDTASNSTLADKHAVGLRTMQRIRKAGELGLLDSPVPLLQRVLPQVRQIATRANGHHPLDTLTTP